MAIGRAAMTAAGKTPTRSRFARFRRFLLRFVFWATIALVVLLAVLWVLRRQLVAPLLRPELEAVLREVLAADRVTLGAFDGDWLTGIQLPEITIEGARTPLRLVRGAHVTAGYSLWALLRGDLAGLRTVQVTIAAAELDLRPASTPAAKHAAAAGPIDQDLLRQLLRVCPAGATVHIDDLQVMAPGGDRQGPLAMTLDAGGDERRVFLTYAGVTLDVHVPAPAPDQPPQPLTAQVDAAAPGELLDLFGLGGGARGGRLRAAVTATLQPLALDASIQLEDLQHGGRRLAQSHATARLDAERLAITEAVFDLPGVQVAVHSLELQNPWAAGSDPLRGATGTCTVQLLDLAPYAELLPTPVRDLLPIQGQLAGSIGDGLLRLDAGELHARGADLVLAAGSLALDAGDWRAAAAALHVHLTLDAFAPPLPELGEARLTGSLRGTLTGSLAEPAADVQIDLGAFGSQHGSFTRAAGSVHADTNGLVVTDLHVVGLVVPATGSEGESDLRLDASCRLRDGAIDPDSLAATLDLDSHVATALLVPIFTAEGLGPVPAGAVTVHVQAAHDANGLTIAALRVRTADASPFTVAIDGTGRVPLHWKGGAELQTLDEGELVVQAAAQRPAVADTPAASFACTINLAAHTITLSELSVVAGAFGLRGELTAGRGIGDLVDPDLDVAAVPLRLALDLEELDLARVPASWLGDLVLQGRVTGHVASTGTAQDIEPSLRLVWTDGALRAPELPELTDVQLRLDTAASTPGAATVLTANLSASVADGTGGRRLATTAVIRCDDDGTRLLPTEVTFGDALVTVDLTASLRRSELQSGVFFGPMTTVAGTIGCRDLSLDTLPVAWLGAPLRGRVDGEVQLEGTTGPDFATTVVRRARLSVHGGEGKLPGVPRLEEFAAEATYDAHALVLHSLSCLLGAGRVTASGSLRQPDRPLLESWDEAPLDLRLTGENVLLHRGDGARVRASVQLAATGTPSAIALGGEVGLGRGSKYVRRISLLPDLHARGGGVPGEGLHLPALPPAIGSRLALDIALRTDAPFEVRTDLFDGEIDVAAHLRGTGSEPRLEGAASARRGILRFPGANLHLTSGQLTFTRGEPLHPSLQVRAEGKRMGFLVTMTVSGPYDRPEVQLASVPALEPQEVIVLLTTGQLPSTLVERGTMGQARLVGGYLAKEAYASLFGSESTERGESLLDRLTIEAGREVSKNGVESVLVEYELLPNLALRAERDAYEDYNLGIVLRWRFR